MLNIYLLLGVMAFTPISNETKDQEANNAKEAAIIAKGDGDRSQNAPEADHDWGHDHGDHDDDWDHHHHDHDDDDDWDHHHHHGDEDGDHHWW